MSYAIFSMLCYCASILLIAPSLAQGQTAQINKTWVLLTALAGIALHYLSLHYWEDVTPDGTTMTLLEVSSLLSLFIAILATIPLCLKVRTISFLLPIAYGFAIINLIMAEFIPSKMVQLHQHIFAHIVLSMVAYSVCFIAMLYSIQITWLDNNLKQKKIMPSPAVPPLMLVERHFFRVLLSGEILLTITLISGAFYLADSFEPSNIHKALFSLFAWIVFGVLLLGHWKWHWRGKRMIIFTISGMILLTIAYFGSKII